MKKARVTSLPSSLAPKSESPDLAWLTDIGISPPGEPVPKKESTEATPEILTYQTMPVEQLSFLKKALITFLEDLGNPTDPVTLEIRKLQREIQSLRAELASVRGDQRKGMEIALRFEAEINALDKAPLSAEALDPKSWAPKLKDLTDLLDE
ncbi:MAG: hypothetical protein JRJ79_17165 [Deltaproteobacteria bacterium]|nr:hypothetical protein [Deltaproteobacteria bacterium]